MKFEVMNSPKTEYLRKHFINTFVNTKADKYYEHIELKKEFEDGLFYIGYLWDFLKDNTEYEKGCDIEIASAYLRNKQDVYVMWDLFSQERVFDKSKFATEYPKDVIIKMSGSELADTVIAEWGQNLNRSGCWFPEDIYCFDETMEWYVIFTHETWNHVTKPELGENEHIRICFIKKN